MPIYDFRCPKCGAREEVWLQVAHRNESQIHSCGTVMERLISLPQSPIIKQTANDITLTSLNSKETSHMKSYVKQLAAQGLERNKSVVGRGF